MNFYAVLAGVIALFAFVGHITIGRKMFLHPMMEAGFDALPKKVMLTVFHYVSIFQFLSALMLIMPGIRGASCNVDPTPLFGFIGLNYLVFAIGQVIIALRARISLLKMFQWIFWILIGTLSFMAVNAIDM